MLFFLLAQSIAPAQAFAACGSSTGTPIQQVQSGVSETNGDCTGTGVTTIIGNVVNILSIVIGSVAIIMILVSGFRYITSGGEAARVTSAKNALIYALVGVAIASLAQLLVHFVLYQTTNVTTPPATPPAKTKTN